MSQRIVRQAIIYLLGFATWGVLLSAPRAYAQVAFVMAGAPRLVRAEGTAEAVGMVALTSQTIGTIKSSSTISLDYGTTIEAGTGTVTGTGTFTTVVSGNVLTIIFTADSVYGIGNGIAISGVRVNANAFVGTTINATGSATVPAAFAATNPITFSFGNQVPVAMIQPKATTVTITNGNPILVCDPTVNSTVSIKVAENFLQALTSAADETGLGGVGGGAVGVTVRFAFANVPVGIQLGSATFTGTSGTITGTATTFTTFTSAAGAQTITVNVTFTGTSTVGAPESLVLNLVVSVPDATKLLTSTSSSGTVSVSLVGGTLTQVPRFAANTQGSGTAIIAQDCRRKNQLTSE